MRFVSGVKNGVAAIIAATLFFCACSKPAKPRDGRLNVIVSSYAAYAIAKETLKDIADIKMLIPPGVEPHHFEPSPRTAADIAGADFFFFVSGALEPWAMQISDGKGIALAYQLPDTGPADNPHVWISFKNAAVMAENMARYIARKRPDLEHRLAQNVADFTRETQMLDRLYKISLADCQSRTIYHVGHNAFYYFAYDYKLDFEPLIGSAFDGEPSAKEMAMMIKDIKAKNTKYIFSEESMSPRLAQTIAAETGAQILYLYTIEHVTKQEFEKQTTYKQFMTENLESLKKGLGCKI